MKNLLDYLVKWCLNDASIENHNTTVSYEEIMSMCRMYNVDFEEVLQALKDGVLETTYECVSETYTDSTEETLNVSFYWSYIPYQYQHTENVEIDYDYYEEYKRKYPNQKTPYDCNLEEDE